MKNLTKKTVLVVDDDDDLRELICLALEQDGHSVISFDNPMTALQELQAKMVDPDLMLVDFHMNGMLGTEFMQAKVKMNPGLARVCPAILITAAFEEVKGKGSEDYFVDLLPKPINLETLLTTVKKTLA